MDLQSWFNRDFTDLGGRPQGRSGGQVSTVYAPNDPSAAGRASMQQMLSEAERLAGIENSRFDTEYGRMNKASSDFNKGFEADETRLTSLATGSQFDQIGQGAVDQSRQMRTQLGGRGIDPSSGTAASLANRIGMQQATLKYGAMRGAAMDSYQRRNAHRTAQYAQQLNTAQFGNQSPSMIGLDALTNKAEFDLADLVSKRQTDAAKYGANKAADAAKKGPLDYIFAGLGLFT